MEPREESAINSIDPGEEEGNAADPAAGGAVFSHVGAEGESVSDEEEYFDEDDSREERIRDADYEDSFESLPEADIIRHNCFDD